MEKKRPARLHGVTECIETGCGKLYVTINQSPEYNEIFCELGKSGGCPGSHLDSTGRLITFAWNRGTPVKDIIRALAGAQCPSPKWSDGEQVLSCSDGVAKVLRRVLLSEEAVVVESGCVGVDESL